jgi:Zinc knuckle
MLTDAVQLNGYVVGGGARNGFATGVDPLLSPVVGCRSSPFDPTGNDVMADIQNQLRELSLCDVIDAGGSVAGSMQSGRYRCAKKPPSTYLCHLCFQKGHFIKDCPQVYHLVRLLSNPLLPAIVIYYYYYYYYCVCVCVCVCVCSACRSKCVFFVSLT